MNIYQTRTPSKTHTHPPKKKRRIRRKGVKNYRVKNRFILVGHTRKRVPFKLTK